MLPRHPARLAQRQPDARPLHAAHPAGAGRGHHAGEQCGLPGRPRGPHCRHGEQRRLPHHPGPGGGARGEARGGGRRGAGAPGGDHHGDRRGALRAREAHRLHRGRRLRHGDAVRLADRWHHLHVRRDHLGVMAAGGYLSGVRRHIGMRTRVEDAAELGAQRHQGVGLLLAATCVLCAEHFVCARTEDVMLSGCHGCMCVATSYWGRRKPCCGFLKASHLHNENDIAHAVLDSISYDGLLIPVFCNLRQRCSLA
ncbi:unnamed protein product [Prorocentrum cordatum]|uniref:Uncharacterized protein n=1 Tax=Prorocentrum cordatum TaxID=2364126 RepID=A0ABN9PWW6_9DINO|nr:unnamed protein product [Polarella glacialis]